MIHAAAILDRAGAQLGQGLPRVGAALVILVVGLLLARLIGRLVRRALSKLGLDAFLERWDLPDTLERAGLGRSPAHLAGVAVRLSLTAVVVVAALSLLGLEFLSQSLNEFVLFIPRLLAGLALLLVGVVLGALARGWVERSAAQMNLPVAIGPIVQALVVLVFGLTAVAEVGVATAPLTSVVGLALAALAVTLALAFGLGSREVARSLSSARYARADFEVGQTIRLGELRGTIVSIDSAATTLESGEDTIRVPNHLLVEGVVVVEGGRRD